MVHINTAIIMINILKEQSLTLAFHYHSLLAEQHHLAKKLRADSYNFCSYQGQGFKYRSFYQ